MVLREKLLRQGIDSPEVIEYRIANAILEKVTGLSKSEISARIFHTKFHKGYFIPSDGTVSNANLVGTPTIYSVSPICIVNRKEIIIRPIGEDPEPSYSFLLSDPNSIKESQKLWKSLHGMKSRRK